MSQQWIQNFLKTLSMKTIQGTKSQNQRKKTLADTTNHGKTKVKNITISMRRKMMIGMIIKIKTETSVGTNMLSTKTRIIIKIQEGEATEVVNITMTGMKMEDRKSNSETH